MHCTNGLFLKEEVRKKCEDFFALQDDILKEQEYEEEGVVCNR